ncbi:hypothetical protein BDN71DRAFT_1485108 [Pleurotus eryngii]|uniref:Uncharacterized protein n=1 Tax=Pleurotus eryngii TaxID=5323 RepID=A0A9P6D971_PLEER|nr:hypothetical protein BDN71DRAFT_1485108 [Pleurotus eryngii]
MLPPGLPPPPRQPADAKPNNPWNPFPDRLSFEFADYHFTTLQSSEFQVNQALDLWLAAVVNAGGDPCLVPWQTAKQMYGTIDAIKEGPTSWKTVQFHYTGPLLKGTPLKWMQETYKLCFQDPHSILLNQIALPELQDHFDYAPYMQFNAHDDHVWSNLMSGDWAWAEAVSAMLVSILIGSDKMTVSVATGHQEYHPVYIGAGNIHNSMRCSHAHGMEPVALLPIPKTSKKHWKHVDFQTFSSIFSIGPYIADYPEQVWLAGVVQNWCASCDATPDNLDNPNAGLRDHETTQFLIRNFDPGVVWNNFGVCVDVVPFTQHFPWADIHKLLTPDLLHQLIKGTFKDHLVTWVEEYLTHTHGERVALAYIQEIDQRVSAVPVYPGLDFSQWTGDDSKALMKVYISAIAGLVPSKMVQCIAAFMECCYIARRNAITSLDLKEFERHVICFHEARAIFVETGVRTSISLPRQHSLVHYASKIELFGLPNGHCSSITESKHIKAVKQPWRPAHGVTHPISEYGVVEAEVEQDNLPLDQTSDNEDGPVSGPRSLSQVTLAATPAHNYPRTLQELASHINQPGFPMVLWRFVYTQCHSNYENFPLILPEFTFHILVFHSAIALFYAPSNLCGSGGMHREQIRANLMWNVEDKHSDDGSVDSEELVMHGLLIAHILLFFSFNDPKLHQEFPCALVNWFMY